MPHTATHTNPSANSQATSTRGPPSSLTSASPDPTTTCKAPWNPIHSWTSHGRHSEGPLTPNPGVCNQNPDGHPQVIPVSESGAGTQWFRPLKVLHQGHGSCWGGGAVGVALGGNVGRGVPRDAEGAGVNLNAQWGPAHPGAHPSHHGSGALFTGHTHAPVEVFLAAAPTHGAGTTTVHGVSASPGTWWSHPCWHTHTLAMALYSFA